MVTGLDVKVLRVRAGLRQRDVANSAGISPQRVSELEHRARLTPEAAERLAAAIDLAASGGAVAPPGELIALDELRDRRARRLEAQA